MTVTDHDHPIDPERVAHAREPAARRWKTRAASPACSV